MSKLITDSYCWMGTPAKLTWLLESFERFCGQKDYEVWFVKTSGALRFENNSGKCTAQPGELIWFVDDVPHSGDIEAYKEACIADDPDHMGYVDAQP